VTDATGAGNSGGASGADDGSPSKPNSAAPSADVMDKAADCISDQAEKAEAAMIAEREKPHHRTASRNATAEYDARGESAMRPLEGRPTADGDATQRWQPIRTRALTGSCS